MRASNESAWPITALAAEVLAAAWKTSEAATRRSSSRRGKNSSRERESIQEEKTHAREEATDDNAGDSSERGDNKDDRYDCGCRSADETFSHRCAALSPALTTPKEEKEEATTTAASRGCKIAPAWCGHLCCPWEEEEEQQQQCHERMPEKQLMQQEAHSIFLCICGPCSGVQWGPAGLAAEPPAKKAESRAAPTPSATALVVRSRLVPSCPAEDLLGQTKLLRTHKKSPRVPCSADAERETTETQGREISAAALWGETATLKDDEAPTIISNCCASRSKRQLYDSDPSDTDSRTAHFDESVPPSIGIFRVGESVAAAASTAAAPVAGALGEEGTRPVAAAAAKTGSGGRRRRAEHSFTASLLFGLLCCLVNTLLYLIIGEISRLVQQEQMLQKHTVLHADLPKCPSEDNLPQSDNSTSPAEDRRSLHLPPASQPLHHNVQNQTTWRQQQEKNQQDQQQENRKKKQQQHQQNQPQEEASDLKGKKAFLRGGQDASRDRQSRAEENRERKQTTTAGPPRAAAASPACLPANAPSTSSRTKVITLHVPFFLSWLAQSFQTAFFFCALAAISSRSKRHQKQQKHQTETEETSLQLQELRLHEKEEGNSCARRQDRKSKQNHGNHVDSPQLQQPLLESDTYRGSVPEQVHENVCSATSCSPSINVQSAWLYPLSASCCWDCTTLPSTFAVTPPPPAAATAAHASEQDETGGPLQDVERPLFVHSEEPCIDCKACSFTHADTSSAGATVTSLSGEDAAAETAAAASKFTVDEITTPVGTVVASSSSSSSFSSSASAATEMSATADTKHGEATADTAADPQAAVAAAPQQKKASQISAVDIAAGVADSSTASAASNERCPSCCRWFLPHRVATTSTEIDLYRTSSPLVPHSTIYSPSIFSTQQGEREQQSSQEENEELQERDLQEQREEEPLIGMRVLEITMRSVCENKVTSLLRWFVEEDLRYVSLQLLLRACFILCLLSLVQAWAWTLAMGKDGMSVGSVTAIFNVNPLFVLIFAALVPGREEDEVKRPTDKEQNRQSRESDVHDGQQQQRHQQQYHLEEDLLYGELVTPESHDMQQQHQHQHQQEDIGDSCQRRSCSLLPQGILFLEQQQQQEEEEQQQDEQRILLLLLQQQQRDSRLEAYGKQRHQQADELSKEEHAQSPHSQAEDQQEDQRRQHALKRREDVMEEEKVTADEGRNNRQSEHCVQDCVQQMVAVFLGLVGVALVAYHNEGEPRSPGGVALAVLAAVAAALYEVLYKSWLLGGRSDQPLSFVFLTVGVMGCMTFSFLWCPIVLLHAAGLERFPSELPPLPLLLLLLLVSCCQALHSLLLQLSLLLLPSPLLVALWSLLSLPAAAASDWVAGSGGGVGGSGAAFVAAALLLAAVREWGVNRRTTHDRSIASTSMSSGKERTSTSGDTSIGQTRHREDMERNIQTERVCSIARGSEVAAEGHFDGTENVAAVLEKQTVTKPIRWRGRERQCHEDAMGCGAAPPAAETREPKVTAAGISWTNERELFQQQEQSLAPVHEEKQPQKQSGQMQQEDSPHGQHQQEVSIGHTQQVPRPHLEQWSESSIQIEEEEDMGTELQELLCCGHGGGGGGATRVGV